MNPARALYERLGFRQVADQGVYLMMEWNATRRRCPLTDRPRCRASASATSRRGAGESFRMRTPDGTEDLVLLGGLRLAVATEAPGDGAAPSRCASAAREERSAPQGIYRSSTRSSARWRSSWCPWGRAMAGCATRRSSTDARSGLGPVEHGLVVRTRPAGRPTGTRNTEKLPELRWLQRYVRCVSGGFAGPRKSAEKHESLPMVPVACADARSSTADQLQGGAASGRSTGEWCSSWP